VVATFKYRIEVGMCEIIKNIENHLICYSEIEIILLKGHLILEQAITQLLGLYLHDVNHLKKLNLQFAKKVDLLLALTNKNFFGSDQLKEINRIRNKLAHQLDFSDYHEDLRKWACSVLNYTPKTINRKRTYRNTVIKAFVFLAGCLDGLQKGLKLSIVQ
jgi:hypothetical protein